MIQSTKIIEIGKYKFDVSNISVKRKRIAVKDWYDLFNIKTNPEGEPILNSAGNIQEIETPKKRTEKQATRGLLKIGLYLVRQDFKILNRRFKFTDAVKEYFKRYFLSVRYIETLTPEEMNNFVEWVYEYITGKKKRVENLLEMVKEQIAEITKGMTEKEMLNFSTYLANSCCEQANQFQSLRAMQKKA